MAVSSKAQRLSRISFAVLALAGLYILAANFMPFHPLTIHSYVAEPNMGCPNTPINLSIDRTRTSSFWGEAKRYRLETYWQRVSDGFSTELQTFEGAASDWGDNLQGPSPVTREAPTEPEAWRVVTHVDLYGRVLAWRRETVIDFTSELPVFSTLPASSPECR